MGRTKKITYENFMNLLRDKNSLSAEFEDSKCSDIDVLEFDFPSDLDERSSYFSFVSNYLRSVTAARLVNLKNSDLSSVLNESLTINGKDLVFKGDIVFNFSEINYLGRTSNKYIFQTN